MVEVVGYYSNYIVGKTSVMMLIFNVEASIPLSCDCFIIVEDSSFVDIEAFVDYMEVEPTRRILS